MTGWEIVLLLVATITLSSGVIAFMHYRLARPRDIQDRTQAQMMQHALFWSIATSALWTVVIVLAAVAAEGKS